MTIPQKPLDLSKMPSLSKSLPRVFAQGAFKEPLQNKSYANAQVRDAQKLTQKRIHAGEKVSSEQLHAVDLLKRKLANEAGTPTVSHAVARRVFVGEQATEKTLSTAHRAHFLRAPFRTPGLTAAYIEQRALKTFVGRQKPVDDKSEMLKKTARVYQAQRAEEAGEAPVAHTDRERLQYMQAEREKGEYASEVLKSVETGKPVSDATKTQKDIPKPSIPFAQNPGI